MANICQFIIEERSEGDVFCYFYHGKEIIPRKNRLKKLGLSEIVGFWVEVTRDEARLLLINCLSRNLSNDKAVMDKTLAEKFSSQFIKRQPRDARLLTNTADFSVPYKEGHYGLEPISSAAFDTGILVEKQGVVALLWVADTE